MRAIELEEINRNMENNNILDYIRKSIIYILMSEKKLNLSNPGKKELIITKGNHAINGNLNDDISFKRYQIIIDKGIVTISGGWFKSKVMKESRMSLFHRTYSQTNSGIVIENKHITDNFLERKGTSIRSIHRLLVDEKGIVRNFIELEKVLSSPETTLKQRYELFNSKTEKIQSKFKKMINEQSLINYGDVYDYRTLNNGRVLLTTKIQIGKKQGDKNYKIGIGKPVQVFFSSAKSNKKPFLFGPEVSEFYNLLNTIHKTTEDFTMLETKKAEKILIKKENTR